MKRSDDIKRYCPFETNSSTFLKGTYGISTVRLEVIKAPNDPKTNKEVALKVMHMILDDVFFTASLPL